MQDGQAQAQYSQPKYPQNQHLQQQYPQPKGGEKNLGRGKGGGFVVEEDKSYVIIVGNHDIFLGMERALQIHVRILNHFIILLNYVRS